MNKVLFIAEDNLQKRKLSGNTFHEKSKNTIEMKNTFTYVSINRFIYTFYKYVQSFRRKICKQKI